MKSQIFEKKLFKNKNFWLTGVFLLAALFRLYQLESLPPGFTGDEAWLGIDAAEILKKGWIGIYIPGHAFGYQALHAYLAALPIGFFGQTITATRLAAVFPGMMSLVFFYLLSRHLFAFPIRLFSLALLAVSRWHIHFSRLAFPGIMLTPLFAVMSLFFFLEAIKSKRKQDFILSGLALGLGINSYFFFAATLATFGALVLILGLTNKKIRWLFQKKLVWLLLPVMILVAPLGHQFIKSPELVGGKWEFRNIFSPQNRKLLVSSGQVKTDSWFSITAHQTKATLGGFFRSGDTDGLNNYPGLPLLEFPLSIFFLIGIGAAIWRISKLPNYFLLVWFLFSITTGILTESAPNAKRIVDASLPTFLLIGNGFNFLWEKRGKKILFLAGIVFLYSAVFNYQAYLIKYKNDSGVASRFANEIVQMCEVFHQKKINPYVYFYHSNTYFNYETRRFLCGNLEGEDRSREYGQYSLENNQDRLVAFVYFDGYEKTAEELKHKFPSGEQVNYSDQSGRFVWGYHLIENENFK